MCVNEILKKKMKFLSKCTSNNSGFEVRIFDCLLMNSLESRIFLNKIHFSIIYWGKKFLVWNLMYFLKYWLLQSMKIKICSLSVPFIWFHMLSLTLFIRSKDMYSWNIILFIIDIWVMDKISFTKKFNEIKSVL